MNNQTQSGKNNLNITIGYNKMKFNLKCKSFKAKMNNITCCGRNNMNITIKYNKMNVRTI
jgi:hypothetical protein